MAPTAGYEPIPDVEEGISNALGFDEQAQTELAKKRYPNANHMEASFLGKLDYAIENSSPTVSLPKVKAADLGSPVSATEFLSALLLPTAFLVLALAAGVAIVVVLSESPPLVGLFPFFVCMLLFLSSIPPTRERLMKSSQPAFAKVEETKKVVDDRVGGVCDRAIGYLHETQGSMDKVIEPIRSTADIATKAESMLRTIVPDIDIPDVSDVERSFDGFESTIRGGFSDVTQSVDVTGALPKALQSRANFETQIILPFLGVFFLLQLGSALLAMHIIAIASDADEGVDVTTDTADGRIRRFLQAALRSLDAVADGDADQGRWVILWYCALPYVVAIIQIATAFYISQSSFYALLINRNVKNIEGQVNRTLDDRVGDTFRVVFKDGFGTVRTKTLELMKKVDKIKGPLKDLQDKMPANLPMDIPADLMEKLPSIPDTVEDLKEKLPSIPKTDEVKRRLPKLPTASGIKSSVGKKLGGFGKSFGF